MQAGNAVLVAYRRARCSRQLEAVIDFMQALAGLPVTARYTIGHKTGVAFASETNAPFRATCYGQHRRPVAKNAHRYIVAARAQAAHYLEGVAPVANLEERLWTPPDVGVIGNNLREIRIIADNRRAGRQRQQVDLRAGIGAFEGAHNRH